MQYAVAPSDRDAKGSPMREFPMRAAALLLLALPAALTGGCSQEARQHAADERLRAIYETEWRWRKEQLPGAEDNALSFADRLPKVDPVSEQPRRVDWQETL